MKKIHLILTLTILFSMATMAQAQTGNVTASPRGWTGSVSYGPVHIDGWQTVNVSGNRYQNRRTFVSQGMNSNVSVFTRAGSKSINYNYRKDDEYQEGENQSYNATYDAERAAALKREHYLNRHPQDHQNSERRPLQQPPVPEDADTNDIGDPIEEPPN
jgi:hypothetical protein